MTGPRPAPADLRTASDVDALARALYGTSMTDEGVVHVTALYEPQKGAPRTLLIGPDSPKSAHDFFALNLTRARADAIVVTGKVLREEPELRYDLQGPGDAPAALAAWRTAIVRREEPPVLCVLTSGRGLSPEHPAFHGWARPVVFTSREGAERLEGTSLDVVAHDDPSPRAAVAWLRARGARTVSIEAGPSTSQALYDDPLVVDELVLSLFRGARPPEHVIGPELAALARARAELSARSSPVDVDEPSGPWRFTRLRRSP